jgi:hypothetical protein
MGRVKRLGLGISVFGDVLQPGLRLLISTEVVDISETIGILQIAIEYIVFFVFIFIIE